MHINIQYRGFIASTARVPSFMDELADIAEIMNWPYELWEEDWKIAPDAHFESVRGVGVQVKGHSALRGICMYPHPQMDPLWLVFRPDGSMSSPFQIAVDAADGYPPRRIWLSSKTGNAGPDMHITILRLFDYLNKRYDLHLEIQDPTDFFQTGDEVKLRQLFRVTDTVRTD